MKSSSALLVQSLADPRIVSGKGSAKYRRLAHEAARESLPCGKPCAEATVYGWQAVRLGSDGETVLREWLWTGQHWQEMSIH